MSENIHLVTAVPLRTERRLMRRVRVVAAVAAFGAVTMLASRGFAGPDPHAGGPQPPPPTHGMPAIPAAQHGPAVPGAQHGPAVPGQLDHGAPHAAPASGHESASAHGHAADHQGAAHGEHDPKAPPSPVNWWHGLLGSKQGVTPSLLWRSPEEPPPFLATLINFGVLVYLFVHFGKKPLQEALIKRKEDITREMNEAQRIRQEAEKRLQQYEAKIGSLTQELDLIRRDMREQGDRDRERIIREAEERAQKLRADATHLLDQELEEIRQSLVTETVDQAVRLASQMIENNSTPSDHDRFAEVFLSQLKARQGHGAQKVEPDAVVKGGSS